MIDGNKYNGSEGVSLRKSGMFADIDRTSHGKLKSHDGSSISHAGLKKAIRLGIPCELIKQTWLMANSACEFHKLNPTLFEILLRSIPRKTSLGSELKFWESLMSEDEISACGDSVSLVRELFDHISQSPFIVDLVSVLIVFLGKREAFSVLACIADRVKSRGEKPYLTNSEKFWEWSVFQLMRYIRIPSADDLHVFREFIFRGGAGVLTDAEFVRLVGCFLFEGCKVFTRLGVSWILLRRKSTVFTTETLFKKAFNLSMSWGSYPLSESRRKRLPAIFFESKLPQKIFPIPSFEVTVRSNLVDLEALVRRSLGSLVIRNFGSEKVGKIFDSSTDGTSAGNILHRLEEKDGAIIKIFLFQAADSLKGGNEIVTILVSEENGVAEYMGNRVVYESCKACMRQTEGHLFYQSCGDKRNVIFMFNERVDSISVPCLALDSVSILNFEFFYIY